MELSEEKMFETDEEAMNFLVDMAKKYCIDYYDIVETPHSYGHTMAKIRYIAKVRYNTDKEYNKNYYCNSILLNEEEKIPYYSLVKKNNDRRMSGLSFINIPTSASYRGAWKDDYNQLKEFYN